MGPRPLGRITRQWWGTVHFRIGGRGQQRPNKGFNYKQLGDIGKNIEFIRQWNKFLRRQTIADVLNYSAQNRTSSDDNQLTTQNDNLNATKINSAEKLNSWDIYMIEKGEKKLNQNQIKALESYFGLKLTKNSVRRERI